MVPVVRALHPETLHHTVVKGCLGLPALPELHFGAASLQTGGVRHELRGAQLCGHTAHVCGSQGSAHAPRMWVLGGMPDTHAHRKGMLACMLPNADAPSGFCFIITLLSYKQYCLMY